MPYRDDFYARENILGYTGRLDDNPTVYFASVGGTVRVGSNEQILCRYGHITQAHGIPTNVGRELVRESYAYSISNVVIHGEEHAQECIYGRRELGRQRLGGRNTGDGHYTFHTSRNRFERVTSGNIALLAAASRRHPKLKQMYEAYA